MAKVLVIDDDPLQRMLASRTLADAGHDVHVAEDGQAGLEAIRERKPDLVVSDVVMPRMNGYQVVAAVRAEPAIAATPIMLLTTMAERAQVRLGMTSGADDYLGKPYRPQELVEAVRALLQRNRAHEAAAMSALKDRFDEALRAQQDALSFKYEWQLANELSARWERDTQGGETHREFTGATLLLANLFEALQVRGEDAALATEAFQAVRDSLYLFGAVHVAPFGEDVFGVFDTAPDAPVPAHVHGVRAALALQSAVAHAIGSDVAQRLSIALGEGDVALIPLYDPLHGDAGSAALPGAALRACLALRRFAVESGWRVAADAALPGKLDGQLAVVAQKADFAGHAVCELKPARES
ncbi:response regulator transcription factor [Ramlibacter albus]|uniref:Response regulator n=1 Tax=Ramlibacter albus TaxID=2079448 RepID=A0A923M5Q7_9BURK|nr:response regulator [Ramlibacter albus]MBC5763314.1 response regulator [Ramlibacter albus]